MVRDSSVRQVVYQAKCRTSLSKELLSLNRVVEKMQLQTFQAKFVYKLFKVFKCVVS